MRFTHPTSETAEAAGWRVPTAFSYVVKDGAPQILEPKFLDRLRVRIQFDRREVKPKGGKTQGRLIDVKTGELPVEDLPEDPRIRLHAVVAPSFRYELAEGGNQEHPCSCRRVQYTRLVSYTIAAEGMEGTANHHVGDDPRSIVATLLALLVRGMFAQVVLIGLAEYANRDM